MNEAAPTSSQVKLSTLPAVVVGAPSPGSLRSPPSPTGRGGQPSPGSPVGEPRSPKGRGTEELRGPRYWRSLEELAGHPEFEALLANEFPQGASEWQVTLSRRRFLQLAGASMALAGIYGCTRQPDEAIVPYVQQPENVIPGKPLFFATAHTLNGYARGILVESHEGRPTKIEGNPDHPASPGPQPADHGTRWGSADIFAQAAILELYDPDRSQTVHYLDQISTWDDFTTAMQKLMTEQRAQGGAGFRILTETVTSPTLARQIEALLAALPQARWHQYQPINRDHARAGALMAFGRDVQTVYQFDRAERVLALDADFLAAGPAGGRYARDFIARRQVNKDTTQMNRLYVVEPSPTITGAMADHRLSVRPSQVETAARALAKRLGVDGAAGDETGLDDAWIAAAADDLRAHAGQAVVVVGEDQPAVVHALGHAINEKLGAFGKTVVFRRSVEAHSEDQNKSLRELTADMAAGKVETLIILGGNPVYHAPADLKFPELIQKMKSKLCIHSGLYHDETAYWCHWHIPQAHELETWGDGRAFDGTVTIQQPLIAPLFGGHSTYEILAALLESPQRSGHEILREAWRAGRMSGVAGAIRTFEDSGPASDERAWRKALHDGLVAGTQAPLVEVSLKTGLDWSATSRTGSGAGEYELILRPDPTVGDGRFANNGWLQELPKPLTKLTWDNAALVSPATAARLTVGSGDVIEIADGPRTLEVPAWVLPGQADGCITLHLGYGRNRVGKVGEGCGVNAYYLRTSEALDASRSVRIKKTGRKVTLAGTQHHSVMENRDLVRTGTLDEFKSDRFLKMSPVERQTVLPLTMYDTHSYTEGNQWALSINLSSCIGCNACVIACQSENNIPVVGKEQVQAGREMHWIRVDRYYEGESEESLTVNPLTHFQPLPCMHCENAPCETVCPVGATQHSGEGLNEMVYNRCIGTRYCSNNCPYKVRRFNFLQFTDNATPSYKLMRNPDVTVRQRGVMEKCTYCVQRIQEVKIEAQKVNRAIGDGEIVTACQSACPTEAIVFGNKNDPASKIARLKKEPHDYGLLTDLNTRPRTTYLARVRNPNPRISHS